jgi:DNA-binding beta-propeller fold protein YncE
MAQTIQIYRTNSNTPPTTLLSGVLSAELGAQTKLWIGSGSGNRLLLSSDPADTAAASSAYLKLAGGTLTGPLLLAADPSATLGAATKQYVDSKTAAITAAAAATYLPLAGGNLTGPLTLAADPSAALGAATKQYVDAKPSGALVAPAPPAAPAGALWWDSIGGQLYLNYYDGTSTQWVTATSVPGLVYPITIDQGGTGAITAPQALINLGAAPLSVAAANVGRNLVHNPLFNIAQRGAGAFSASGFTLDRWLADYAAGDAQSVQQYSATDGDRAGIGDEAAAYWLGSTFTGAAGANAHVLLQHSIENVRRLAGKTVTVSFWAVASLAGLKLGFNIDQYFGSGGSPSAPAYGTGQAVTLTASWARYSKTFVLPSVSGQIVGTNGDDRTALVFWLSAGSTYAARSGAIGVQSGTIGLWGVQLEIGSVATPLEKPDPRYDLANCQRFYQQHLQVLTYGYGAAGNAAYGDYWMPVTMRAAPTVTYVNASYSNASGITSTGNRASNIITAINIGATGGGWGMADVLLSADL